MRTSAIIILCGLIFAIKAVTVSILHFAYHYFNNLQFFLFTIWHSMFNSNTRSGIHFMVEICMITTNFKISYFSFKFDRKST